jgi:CBS domain-containing protein
MKAAAGERIGETETYATLATFVRPTVQAPIGESVVSVARRMRDERIGCVVVTSGRQPIGLITDRDLALRVIAEELDLKSTVVDNVLTYYPFTLRDTDTVEAAIRCMKEHGVRRIPIVTADGSIAGIVTADDLIVVLARQLSAVSDALADPSDAGDSR